MLRAAQHDNSVHLFFGPNKGEGYWNNYMPSNGMNKAGTAMNVD
jgi:hypothetical protein